MAKAQPIGWKDYKKSWKLLITGIELTPQYLFFVFINQFFPFV